MKNTNSSLSQKLYVLSTLSKMLSQGVDFDEFLKEAADKIALSMEASRVTVYLIDQKRGELWSKIAHLEEISEIRLKLGQGVAGHVAATGETVNVPTSYSDKRFYDGIDRRTGFKTLSQLCVPLKDHGGEILGVIQVLNKKNGKESFNEEDGQFLQALSGQLAVMIENTSLYQQIKTAHKWGTKAFPLRSRYNNIIGHGPAMQKAFKDLAKVAPTSVTVLIRGETGTGKEMVARAIHLNSPRKDSPFVKIDCTTLPENLLENELFGHEKGAYTGAGQRMPGKIEAAGEGTLFIDELGDLPLPMQGKLLRILQDRQYEMLGSQELWPVKARILAATNRNLEEMVQEKKFREDLYFRIKVAQLVLPPLRERGKEDILALTHHFLKVFFKRHQKDLEGISPEGENLLTSYNWPGNVRELQNCIESAVVFSEGPWLNEEDLALPKKWIEVPSHAQSPLSLREMEKNYIIEVLARVDGNKSKAAEILKIGRNTLHRKLDEYDIS